MRKSTENLEKIVQCIGEMKGVPLRMRINRGRNRFETYSGCIAEVYPSVFIFHVNKSDKMFEGARVLSCNYQDVLCGNIRFKNILQSSAQQ